MNPAQKRTLLLAALVFVGMGVYPPWMREMATKQGSLVKLDRATDYGFIFDPPGDAMADMLWGRKLDISRLAVQWLCLAAFAGALVVYQSRSGKGAKRLSESGRGTVPAPEGAKSGR